MKYLCTRHYFELLKAKQVDEVEIYPLPLRDRLCDVEGCVDKYKFAVPGWVADQISMDSLDKNKYEITFSTITADSFLVNRVSYVYAIHKGDALEKLARALKPYAKLSRVISIKQVFDWPLLSRLSVNPLE